MRYKESDKEKLKYIKANRELFVDAYIEYVNNTHRRTKHSEPNNYSKFMTKVRQDFSYSPSTNSIDIWIRFVMVGSDITKEICNKIKAEKLKSASIRRALGYIDDKLRP